MKPKEFAIAEPISRERQKLLYKVRIESADDSPRHCEDLKRRSSFCSTAQRADDESPPLCATKRPHLHQSVEQPCMRSQVNQVRQFEFIFPDSVLVPVPENKPKGMLSPSTFQMSVSKPGTPGPATFSNPMLSKHLADKPETRGSPQAREMVYHKRATERKK